MPTFNWLMAYMATGVLFGVWQAMTFLNRAEVVIVSRGEAIVIGLAYAAVCAFLWPVFFIQWVRSVEPW